MTTTSSTNYVSMGGASSNEAPDFLSELDYSQEIFNSLPQNAQKYFKKQSGVTLDSLISKLTVGEHICRAIGSIPIFPLFFMTYVNSNEIVPVLINGKHRLIKGPGYHWVSGISDKMGTPVPMSTDITFGSIKLIYVSPGTLKFAHNTETSKPILMGPGMHFFDDNTTVIRPNAINLSFKGENTQIDINDGAFTFVFIKTGFQGVVNKRGGELEILSAGLHFIESPDSFVQFASIQQEHFKFGSCDKGTPAFLTADNVELHVDATLFYNISDVKRAFTTSIKSEMDLFETLHSQAMATLMTIIRSENFSNIGKREMNRQLKTDMDVSQASSDVPMAEATFAPSAPPSQLEIKHPDTLSEVAVGFQSIIHDAEPRFRENMQSNFGDRMGFEFQSLRIEKIEFADKKIQKQVSELAMTYTKLSAQEATIAAQKKVEIAEVEREAAKLRIKTSTQAEMNILMQRAENEITSAKISMENDILLKTTAAKMESLELEANMLAKNKITMANAEAKNRITAANAEAAYILEVDNAETDIIDKKNKLPNAPLRIMADSQVEALKGVSKVIYTSEHPFLLQNLNKLTAEIPDTSAASV